MTDNKGRTKEQRFAEKARHYDLEERISELEQRIASLEAILAARKLAQKGG